MNTLILIYTQTEREVHNKQRWSRGHKARGQGQGHKKIRDQDQGQPFRGQTLSRPRTGMLEAKDQGHKKNPRPRTAFPRTDTLEAKDRNAQGQGQGPRTQAQVLSKKKKKKGLHKQTFPKKCFKRSTKF